MNNFETKEFLLKCECGCSILAVTKYDNEIDFNMYGLLFYSHQRTILDRLKVIWNVLKGKDHHFFDIIVPNESFQEFKDWIKEL